MSRSMLLFGPAVSRALAKFLKLQFAFTVKCICMRLFEGHSRLSSCSSKRENGFIFFRLWGDDPISTVSWTLFTRNMISILFVIMLSFLIINRTHVDHRRRHILASPDPISLLRTLNKMLRHSWISYSFLSLDSDI